MSFNKFFSWFGFLCHPRPNLIWGSIYAFTLLLFFYWMWGYALLSNPSAVLYRSEGLEDNARLVLKLGGNQYIGVPNIYVMPIKTRDFFWSPYAFIRHVLGAEEKYSNIVFVEVNQVVLQEDATLEDFYHEIGHIVDYQSDPERYKKKSWGEQEFFASDFAQKIVNQIVKKRRSKER